MLIGRETCSDLIGRVDLRAREGVRLRRAHAGKPGRNTQRMAVLITAYWEQL